MKKMTQTLAIILASITLIAQPPQAFKYQAVVRDNVGNIINNQLISIRCSIIHDSINGSAVYSETHSTTTNQFGMMVLEIGRGTIETGVFEDIDWGITSHFLELEFDETGGTNYQFMGISELLSVPYCINSASLTLTSPGGADYEITVDDDGNLIVACFPEPSIAYAGPDQLNIDYPVTLAANNPVNGTGYWTIVSGTGGIINDPNDPTSAFSGIVDSFYTLRWTITTSANCFTEDDVDISTENCLPTVTDIDGNIYNIVSIGTQCWFKENLNIGTRINDYQEQTNNQQIEKYCYNDNEYYCTKYGGLYQWDEMMQYSLIEGVQGICPSGWHVPSQGDWTELTDFIGGTSSPHGNELKSCRQQGSPLGGDCNTSEQPRWDYINDDIYGTDDYGFSGIPGGTRFSYGSFGSLEELGILWSSTEFSSTEARLRILSFLNGYVLDDWGTKQASFSVRCIRD